MKRICFLFAIVLFSIIAKAQTPEPPDNPADTIINQEEFKNTVFNDLINHLDTCNIPVLKEISVVRFNTIRIIN